MWCQYGQQGYFLSSYSFDVHIFQWKKLHESTGIFLNYWCFNQNFDSLEVIGALYWSSVCVNNWEVHRSVQLLFVLSLNWIINVIVDILFSYSVFTSMSWLLLWVTFHKVWIWEHSMNFAKGIICLNFLKGINGLNFPKGIISLNFSKGIISLNVRSGCRCD